MNKKLTLLTTFSVLTAWVSTSYGFVCWKLLGTEDTACDLSWCVPASACDTTVLTDENVFIKVSDTPGRKAIAIDALCDVDYLTRNKFNICNVPNNCAGLVGSYILSGLPCPSGPPA